MKLSLRFLCLMSALALAGCGSAPPQYYTLIPVTSEQSVKNLPDAVDPYVLGEIVVPADVDKTSLVAKDRDGHVMVLEYDRWASPLEGQLQSAVTKGLTQQLGFPPLQNFNRALNDKRYSRVRLAIHSFDMFAGEFAEITAVWLVSFAGSDKTLSCFTQVRQNVNPGVSELVVAQQQNVAKLSELIAAVLKTKAAPASVVCRSL